MSNILDEVETYLRHQIDPSLCDGLDCHADSPQTLLDELSAASGPRVVDLEAEAKMLRQANEDMKAAVAERDRVIQAAEADHKAERALADQLAEALARMLGKDGSHLLCVDADEQALAAHRAARAEGKA